jgi:hypothetical protein
MNLLLMFSTWLLPVFYPRRKSEKREGSFVGWEEWVMGRGNWKVTFGEDGEWGLGCFLRMKGEG